jgi:transcriptional regulator with XRE-family HTH domain
MGAFSTYFAAVLEARGLTQVEAAQLLGESQANISRWLAGVEPSLTKALHIASRLGVPISKDKDEVPTSRGKQRTTTEIRSGEIPIAALRKFRTRFRQADPNLKKFMSAQVRALFGSDSKRILSWLAAP